jgi:hypothetical protein
MLAGTHGELLQWHLIKHPSRSLALCIAALADDGGALPLLFPSSAHLSASAWVRKNFLLLASGASSLACVFNLPGSRETDCSRTLDGGSLYEGKKKKGKISFHCCCLPLGRLRRGRPRGHVQR